jgi:hypothetical protein
VASGNDISAGPEDSDDGGCIGDPCFISSLSPIFSSTSEVGDAEGVIESFKESGVFFTEKLDDITRGGRGGGIGRGGGEATSAERLSGATSALRSSVSVRIVDWLSEPCCWPVRIGLFHKRYMLGIAGPFNLLSGDGDDGAMFPIDSGSPRWLA